MQDLFRIIVQNANLAGSINTLADLWPHELQEILVGDEGMSREERVTAGFLLFSRIAQGERLDKELLREAHSLGSRICAVGHKGFWDAAFGLAIGQGRKNPEALLWVKRAAASGAPGLKVVELFQSIRFALARDPAELDAAAKPFASLDMLEACRLCLGRPLLAESPFWRSLRTLLDGDPSLLVRMIGSGGELRAPAERTLGYALLLALKPVADEHRLQRLVTPKSILQMAVRKGGLSPSQRTFIGAVARVDDWLRSWEGSPNETDSILAALDEGLGFERLDQELVYLAFIAQMSLARGAFGVAAAAFRRYRELCLGVTGGVLDDVFGLTSLVQSHVMPGVKRSAIANEVANDVVNIARIIPNVPAARAEQMAADVLIEKDLLLARRKHFISELRESPMTRSLLFDVLGSEVYVATEEVKDAFEKGVDSPVRDTSVLDSELERNLARALSASGATLEPSESQPVCRSWLTKTYACVLNSQKSKRLKVRASLSRRDSRAVLSSAISTLERLDDRLLANTATELLLDWQSRSYGGKSFADELEILRFLEEAWSFNPSLKVARLLDSEIKEPYFLYDVEEGVSFAEFVDTASQMQKDRMGELLFSGLLSANCHGIDVSPWAAQVLHLGEESLFLGEAVGIGRIGQHSARAADVFAALVYRDWSSLIEKTTSDSSELQVRDALQLTSLLDRLLQPMFQTSAYRVELDFAYDAANVLLMERSLAQLIVPSPLLHAVRETLRLVAFTGQLRPKGHWRSLVEARLDVDRQDPRPG